MRICGHTGTHDICRYPRSIWMGSRALLRARLLRIRRARALVRYRACWHRRGAEQAPQNRVEVGFWDFGDVGHETIVRSSACGWLDNFVTQY